jgi:hypothetical protein
MPDLVCVAYLLHVRGVRWSALVFVSLLDVCSVHRRAFGIAASEAILDVRINSQRNVRSIFVYPHCLSAAAEHLTAPWRTYTSALLLDDRAVVLARGANHSAPAEQAIRELRISVNFAIIKTDSLSKLPYFQFKLPYLLVQ